MSHSAAPRDAPSFGDERRIPSGFFKKSPELGRSLPKDGEKGSSTWADVGPALTGSFNLGRIMPELGSRGGGQQRLPKVKRPFKTPAALAVILLGSILPPIFSAGWALALASPTSYRVAHAQWDGGSKSVVISGDGRHVAYETYVYPDWQVYVFDVNTNATTLVSANSSGAQADTGGSQPSISYDGHYIAFVSGAANLGSSSGQCSIYVRNTVAGTTSLVSVGSNPAGNSCATS